MLRLGVRQRGRDEGHHADPVVVADHQHRPGDRQLDVVVVDHHDLRLAPQPEQGPADGMAGAPQG